MSLAKLVVGTARLGEGIESHAAALQAALDGGIRTIDTAASYGSGGSERLVDKVLMSLPASVRREVNIVSKYVALLMPQKWDSAP